MSNQSISDLETRILLALKHKSFSQVARDFGLSETRLHEMIGNAQEKRARLSELLEKDSVPASAQLAEQVPFVRVFRLEKKIGELQTGTMKVGSQILELLSKGIYSAPENAVKELLSNSFDADAPLVSVRSDPLNDSFTVDDHGDGMDYMDFDQNFTFISRSTKRDYGVLTKKFRRPIIGKIGIGFIAVSELCGKMKVISAKRGSDTWFEASIDFERFRTPEAKRKEFYEVSQFRLVNREKEDPEEHYTKIQLSDLRPHFRDILLNKMPDDSQPKKVIEGKTMEAIVKQIREKKIRNINRECGPYWRFLLNLAAIVPVAYLKNGPLRIKTKKRQVQTLIDSIATYVESLHFRVEFNGIELNKPVSLPTDDSIHSEGKDFDVFPLRYDDFLEDGSRLKLRGYVYNQRKNIVPEDWRGLVTRIKSTSIGVTDPGFFDHPYPGDKLYLSYSYGEIYIEDGLEGALNIDRSTFKTSHDHYQALKEFLNETLRKTVFTRAKQRWADRRRENAFEEKAATEHMRKKLIKAGFGSGTKLFFTRRQSQVPIFVSTDRKQIIVFTQHPLLKAFEKQSREFLIDILLAFEAAVIKSKRDAEAIRTAFLHNLQFVSDEDIDK